MTEAEVRLAAEGVTRAFGPVVANDGIDLSIRRGSVHAIIGENGAGKTTLMRILYGLDQPDEGQVLVDGQPVFLSSPRQALKLGIGMVQQELSLLKDLTLLENLILGHEPTRGPFINWDLARQSAAKLAADTGLEIDWDMRASQAPVNLRQQLEVLRLLYWGADVLILDEPTAVLAPQQVEELFRLLRSLVAEGRTVVFISHKLVEVLALADRISVLRRGRTVAELDRADATRDGLVELMVGERIHAHRAARVVAPPGGPVLAATGLVARDDRGHRRLDGVDLSVRTGEILGVAGVAGNGQDELVETIVGLRRLDQGTLKIDGLEQTNTTVGRRRGAGMVYISPDRRGEGLAVDASLVANSLAGLHRSPVRSSRGWLRRRLPQTITKLLGRYGVQFGNVKAPASSLSGGNQQRLVAARELDHDPKLIIAAQPTRGVDVRGIRFVHDELRRLRDEGAGVLLISEELDELLGLADRLVVLNRGQVVGELAAKDADRHVLGRLMTGEAAA